MSSTNIDTTTPATTRTPWPFAVYTRTMSFLSTRDVIRLRQLSHAFKENCEFDQLWEYLVQRDYPEFGLQKIEEERYLRGENASSTTTTTNDGRCSRYEEVMEFFFDQIVNSEIEDRQEFFPLVFNKNKKTQKTTTTSKNNKDDDDDDDVNENNKYDPTSSTQHPIFFCRGRLLYCFAGLSTRFPALIKEILIRSNLDNRLPTAPFDPRNFIMSKTVSSSSTTVADNDEAPSSYLQSFNVEEREIHYESSFSMYRGRGNSPATLTPSKWPKPEFSQLSDGTFYLEDETVTEMRACFSLLAVNYSNNKQQSHQKANQSSTLQFARYISWLLLEEKNRSKEFQTIFGNPHLKVQTKYRSDGDGESDDNDDNDDSNNNNNQRAAAAAKRRRRIRYSYSESETRKSLKWITPQDMRPSAQLLDDGVFSFPQNQTVQFVTLFDALFVSYAFHLPRYHYYNRCKIFTYLLNTGLGVPEWISHLRSGDLFSWTRRGQGRYVAPRRVRYAEQRIATAKHVTIHDVQAFPTLLYSSFVGHGKFAALLFQFAFFFSKEIPESVVSVLRNIPLLKSFFSSSSAAEEAATKFGFHDFFGRHGSYLLYSPSQLFSTYSGYFICAVSLGVVGIALLQRGKRVRYNEKKQKSSATLLSPIRATQILLVNSVAMITHTTSYSFVTIYAIMAIDSFFFKVSTALKDESSMSDSSASSESASSLFSPTTQFYIHAVIMTLLFTFNSISTSVLGVYDATMVDTSSQSLPDSTGNTSSNNDLDSQKDEDDLLNKCPDVQSWMSSSYLGTAASVFESTKVLVERKLPFLFSSSKKLKPAAPSSTAISTEQYKRQFALDKTRDDQSKDRLLFAQYALLVAGYGFLFLRGSHLSEILIWPVAMECLCRFVQNV